MELLKGHGEGNKYEIKKWLTLSYSNVIDLTRSLS